MIRIEDVIARVEKNHPGADTDLIRRAYFFSALHHRGQKRASGEPYLIHPLEVADIVADMRLDEVSVSTGLLHDVVEDTLVLLDRQLQRSNITVELRSREVPEAIVASDQLRQRFGHKPLR